MDYGSQRDNNTSNCIVITMALHVATATVAMMSFANRAVDGLAGRFLVLQGGTTRYPLLLRVLGLGPTIKVTGHQ